MHINPVPPVSTCWVISTVNRILFSHYIVFAKLYNTMENVVKYFTLERGIFQYAVAPE